MNDNLAVRIFFAAVFVVWGVYAIGVTPEVYGVLTPIVKILGWSMLLGSWPMAKFIERS